MVTCADYTHILSKGESATRRAVGDTTGEDLMAYTTLSPHTPLDGVILIDLPRFIATGRSARISRPPPHKLTAFSISMSSTTESRRGP